MNRSDFPDKWHDLFSGYVLGNLTPDEQAELTQLLQTQPELRDELRAYEATFDRLPQALEQPLPPSNLEAKILQRVHTPTATSRFERHSSTPYNRRRYLWGVSGAIAAGLLLIVGWDNYRLRRSLTANVQKLNAAQDVIQRLQREQQEIATVLASLQNPDAVYALQGTGEFANTLGSIVTVASENKAILLARDLPSLPEDQVYRFWAATATGDGLMYCGQFTVDEVALVEWSLPDAACGLQTSQAAVTIDPITASTASGGELVMLSLSTEGS